MSKRNKASSPPDRLAMIRVIGSQQQTCEGLTRREVLRVGGLSLFGLTLADKLQLQAATSTPSKAKSVILVFLFGAPSHQDTFDLKPEAAAETRGEFKPISTVVPGLQICEHLPRVAQQMHHLALIRSMSHTCADHSGAALYTMTGHKPPSDADGQNLVARPTDWPSMGSVVSYLQRDRKHAIPPYVFMPHLLGKYQKSDLKGGVRPGPSAGFMGKQFDPFETDCKPSKPAEPAELFLPGMELSAELTLDRLNRRRSLRQQIDEQMKMAERSRTVRELNEMEQRAFDIVTAPAARAAFDLSKETPTLRDRYGRNRYGNSMLTARRLVEAGTQYVTVAWDVILPDFDYDAWDTHGRNFQILKERNLPVFDLAFSALIEDLQQRGLLKETLVICVGEYGRTPKINKSAGRDHWPYCYCALLGGAGVHGGAVYGASDATAAYPTENAVSPQDLAATVYERLGLLDAQIVDSLGRPQPVINGGRPLTELL